MLATLDLPLDDPIKSRNMYVSKQLRHPLKLMNAHVVAATEGKYPDNVEKTKFLMYSTHDWTVAQSWLFMDATNGNYTNVPFASQFVIELHSTEGCNEESCFWVEVFGNGKRYAFEDVCVEDPERCTLDQFADLLDSRGFIHTETGYEEECATPWAPPTKYSDEQILFLQIMFKQYNPLRVN